MRIICLQPWLVVLALVLCSSCGSRGPEVATVRGTVLLDGKPLEGVEIVFQPQGGRYSNAYTDAEGRFTLNYTFDDSGALLGTHEVFLREIPADEDMLPEGVTKRSKVPRKFMDVFDTVTVERKENVFTFDLRS